MNYVIIRCLGLGFLLISITSSNAPKGKLFKTSSTTSLDSDDIKDSIVFKATHVIPTANQYDALKNEFSALIHFLSQSVYQNGVGKWF